MRLEFILVAIASVTINSNGTTTKNTIDIEHENAKLLLVECRMFLASGWDAVRIMVVNLDGGLAGPPGTRKPFAGKFTGIGAEHVDRSVIQCHSMLYG